MRLTMAGVGAAAALMAAGVGAQQAIAPQPQKPQGVLLGGLTWQEAEPRLTASTVIVIPLGLATEQAGPHMKLDSRDRLARYLADRVRAAADVVVAPSLSYHFDPAYLDYPGSTSVSQPTARDMTADIVRSIARHGPKRFYVLNTAATAMFPLKDAADRLADEGILLGYTDFRYRVASARVGRQQTETRGTTHADEIDTSMMLFVDPSSVDMRKAVREYGSGTGAMTRQKDAAGTYSASGVLGDPTLATREKGQIYVEAIVSAALEDIEDIRTARLPAARTSSAAPPTAPQPRPQAARPSEQLLPNGCQPSDDRAIRAVGDRFSYLWRQMDADKLGELFTEDADMRHPDGTIEKTRVVIRQNRRELFEKREYRGSVHPVSLNDIRCISPTVAIADGKWELRLEDLPTSGAPARNLPAAKRHSGWCTLVLTGGSGTGTTAWQITAWRYTVNPPDGSDVPTTLKKPGFIGRGGGL
jgi:creatinine amidohydrolase